MPETSIAEDRTTAPAADTDATAARVPIDTATSALICLPGLAPDVLQAMLSALAEAFPGETLLIASPDPAPADHTNWLTYPSNRACLGWALAAADYATATRLAAEHHASVTLLLGNEAALDPAHLRELADSVRTNKVDLAVPRFHLGPTQGLVNAAILYPLTRALFTSDIHFPLPIDAAISPRMATRLATPTQHLNSIGQGEAFLWPVTEAAIAGLTVREIDAGSAAPPAPSGDFNTLFNSVVGYLFADIDAKATFWQRARALPARTPSTARPLTQDAETSAQIQDQITEMIESFHLAHANLQEIWSLVLPPQSRLALKKLSVASPDEFAMEPALWARIVYDFALAFHLRTLNRGHLIGALTPLYLAWAASHLCAAGSDPTRSARDLDQTAAAFDSEKSYIVSRWRWPDRFNP